MQRTCPEVFREKEGFSMVYQQPVGREIEERTLQAIVSCPTGSIGSVKDDHPSLRRDVETQFPIEVNDNVYYLGFNSPKSYGAKSYLITHPEGNWMVDSPRFNRYLKEKIKEMGGLRYIFLTHRDDVADAEKFAQFFDAEIIIHKFEQKSVGKAHIIVDVDLDISEFRIIAVPGHTKGHCVLLFKNNLFTGDHLYSRNSELRASRRYCWWNWQEQIKSIEKLIDYDFEWILPGHGRSYHLDVDDMKTELIEFVERIKIPDYW